MTIGEWNVTRPLMEFKQTAFRLGFKPSETEGRKVVQLIFRSPERDGAIMYRIPFLSDGSERITLLVQQAEFSGDCGGSEGVPESVREEAHRKLCELIGESTLSAQDRETSNAASGTGQTDLEADPALQATLNGVMAQDEQDLIRLGKEMKAMKTNTELEQEGMIPDPIQN